MRRLFPLIFLFLAAIAVGTTTVIIQYNDAGTLIERTDLALPNPPPPAALTPVSGMRPGKIYINNILPKPNLGSSTANESDQYGPPPPAPGGGYYPGRWPGESLGQVGRNGGAMRVFCARSHFAYDDPIVWPSEKGKTHLHVFFGNTQTGGTSTPTSIRTTGNSTCQGGTMNRSAYWVPAMIYVCNTAAQIAAGCNTARDGEIIEPKLHNTEGAASALNVYYKGYFGIGLGTDTSCPLGDACNASPSWWVFNHDIEPLPVGFRMIAGVPTGTPTAPGTNRSQFACLLADNSETRTQYIPGTGGTTPCAGLYQQIIMEVPFMTCMNDAGVLDSPTHNAHVLYPLDAGGGDFYCPTGYTRVLPGVEFKVHYDTNSVQLRLDAKFYRLSSDNYNTDLPAGYSAHGDWFNGWDATVMATWVTNCMVKGVDCHDGVLGPSLLGTPNMWRYMTPPRWDR